MRSGCGGSRGSVRVHWSSIVTWRSRAGLRARSLVLDSHETFPRGVLCDTHRSDSLPEQHINNERTLVLYLDIYYTKSWNRLTSVVYSLKFRGYQISFSTVPVLLFPKQLQLIIFMIRLNYYIYYLEVSGNLRAYYHLQSAVSFPWKKHINLFNVSREIILAREGSASPANMHINIKIILKFT